MNYIQKLIKNPFLVGKWILQKFGGVISDDKVYLKCIISFACTSSLIFQIQLLIMKN